VSRSLADIAHSPQSSPIIASTRIDAGPRISPDGTKLAFQSNRSGNFQIWISKTDGTVARQLTNMSGTWTGTPRWSPDGKFITFDSRDKGDADVFIVDANGGPPRAVVANPGSNEVVPSWSADGRWIYFASDRTSRWEVWKVAPGGGDPVQITKNGGFAPLESADGTKVFYAKGLGEAGLWQVPNEGGEESSVLEMPEAGYWGYFTPVRNGIYYLDTSHTPALKFFDFSTRSSTRVFDIENPARQTPGMTVSPDGKTVFYTQVGNARSEIDLIDNFP
jgi:Tol biopolymer transport system component